MFFRGGKRLENEPSVSRIYNFYKIRGPLLSLTSRKSTPVFGSCFPETFKQSIIDIPCTCRARQWIMQKHKLLLMLSINSLTYIKTYQFYGCPNQKHAKQPGYNLNSRFSYGNLRLSLHFPLINLQFSKQYVIICQEML